MPNHVEKNFTITQGKGFWIKFENGYSLSVQWGGGNYCDNYMGKRDPDRYEHGSNDAEIAVITPEGKLQTLAGHYDNVKGYCTPAEVLEWMNKVARIPKPR